MSNIIPFWDQNVELMVDENSNIDANMADGVGVDFSFFTGDEAKKIDAGADGTTSKTKKKKPTVAVNGEILPDRGLVNPIPGATVAEMNYSGSYNETNNLIRSTIAQADELNNDIKQDIDSVRSSKTIKNRYTYITNLTASAGALLNTKVSAIKELNSTITQAHNLELSRLKALKLNESEANDDMKMMDIYSAFVNTPIGTYSNPMQMPSIQDITVGVNGMNSNINGIEMVSGVQNGPLSPEQQRMRMESNPNIQTVVRYDQSTGQRCFDVIDKTNGMSIPNFPRPDSFLLEDTTIDVNSGIARNRNINSVWPLMLDGSNSMPINEY